MALSPQETQDITRQVQNFGPISAADAKAFLEIFKSNDPNSTATLADITGVTAINTTLEGGDAGPSATETPQTADLTQTGTVTMTPEAKTFTGLTDAEILKLSDEQINIFNNLAATTTGGVAKVQPSPLQTNEDKLRLIDGAVESGFISLEEAIKQYNSVGITDRTKAIARFNGLDPRKDIGQDLGTTGGGFDTPEFVDVPTPVVTDAGTGFPSRLTAQETGLQGLLRAKQSPDAVFRRVAQDRFGLGENFGGFQERALRPLFNRFTATNPITSFGNVNPLDQQFNEFLDTRPTRAGLGSRLKEILGGVGDFDSPSSANFEGTFFNVGEDTEFGGFDRAFSAAIQPLVQGITPGRRGNLTRVLENRFRNRLAASPGEFTSALDVFRDFQRRGFFEDPNDPAANLFVP